jgi:hypothetical protein
MVDCNRFKNIILASHITGVYDVNRNTTLLNDDFEIVSDWVNSIKALDLQGIIFHNNFSEQTCKKYASKNIQFIKIDYNEQFNPNVFRYFIYDQFLKKYSKSIQNVFFTDVADVVVLKNPFIQKIFIENPTTIFCGDEQEILDNEWMKQHSEHLRNKIIDYTTFEHNFKDNTLLNCGIVGGSIQIMEPFIKKLWHIHEHYNSDNSTNYTGDMGAFNYLMRTQFNQVLIHGTPVNTPFKKYIVDSECWFKHK